MALDLGGIFTNLAGSYINARWGQPNLPPMQQNVGLGQIQGLADSSPMPIPAQTNTLGIPFVDVVGTEGKKGYVYDPNANCGGGKWIRKRRRRHRNLATRGDIKDLSALKGVLGAGKLLEVWIATHS